MEKRVLVCGGRGNDPARVKQKLSEYAEKNPPIDVLIHGAGGNTDLAAGEWARQRGIKVRAYPADWKTYGRAAGPVRNRQMLKEAKPSEVLAYAGGRGTDDMKNAAKAAGVPVYEIDIK